MIADYFRENFSKVRGTDRQLRIDCPFCVHRGKTFAVYLETFSCHCFYSECNYSGSVLKFISDFEGLSYKEAYLRLKEYQRAVDLPRKAQPQIAISEKQGDYIGLWELTKANPLSSRIPMDYLTRRGVTPEQIEKYKIGYRVVEGRGISLVFPIYDVANKLRAWIERSMSDQYRVYPAGVDKRKLLFGINLAKNYQSIVLCEGAFDVFAIGENAVALLGKSLTEDQFALLLKLQPKKKFIVLLDGDAKKDGYRIACKLNHYRDTRLVLLEGKSDPADLKGKIQREILSKVKRVEDYYADRI